MGTLIALPAGAYNWYDTNVSGVPTGSPTSVTVAALTAGTVSPASPTVGQTLSVTGSNAPPGAAFLWQFSSDGGTSYGNAGGTNNGATYNTTGQPAGLYRRRTTLVNGAVATTTAVTLTSSFDPQSLFTGGRDGFSIIPSLTTSFESADNSDPAEIGDGVQFQTDSSGLGTPRNLAQSTGTRRPLLVTSGSAQALDFEFADSRRIPTVAAFQAQSATNGVTLFARINLESISTGEPDQAIIGADDGSGTNNLFSLRVTSGGLLRMFGYTNNSGSFISATGTTVLSTGVWYNVCGIFNPTNARVWVNTMTDAAVEGTTTNSAGTVNAGTQNVVLGNLTNSSGGPIMDGLGGYFFCINVSLNETDRVNLAAFATARGL